jgi:hypothetical protein
MSVVGVEKERKSHIWKRQAEDWYQEPNWVSERLFDVEPFDGLIVDPCCGGGNIVRAARSHGLLAVGCDIEDRGFPLEKRADFLLDATACANIVTNPPFNIAPQLVRRALDVAAHKVAIVFPTRRLNATAGPKEKRWIVGLPLRRVHLLTPRPSMPPGEVILRGEKPGGGKDDFCWLVFEQGYRGPAELKWLHREVDA